MNGIEKEFLGNKGQFISNIHNKDINFSILKAIIRMNILGADKNIEWNYLMFAISVRILLLYKDWLKSIKTIAAAKQVFVFRAFLLSLVFCYKKMIWNIQAAKKRGYFVNLNLMSFLLLNHTNQTLAQRCFHQLRDEENGFIS